jgi:hypothetical protein
MERPNGALDWSTSHTSPFELSKVALMHFTGSAYKAAESGVLRCRTEQAHHKNQGGIIIQALRRVAG